MLNQTLLLKTGAGILALLGLIYLGPVACNEALQSIRSPEPSTESGYGYSPFLPAAGTEHLDRPYPRTRPKDGECPTEGLAPDAPVKMVAVKRVTDGDSITGETAEGQNIAMRLWGMDAPEIRQPHGAEARNRLAELAKPGEIYETRFMGFDMYDRELTVIGESGETPVNITMVKEGLAFHSNAWVSIDNICLEAAQRHAKGNERGVWGTNPNGGQRPWNWRMNNP